MLRIAAPDRRLGDYPHQFSGGMRQRVLGTIALSCDPTVLIADEPTTSLDVTVQASYLALLKRIQQQTSLAILFITHDFGVVSKMCDRVAVMYAGRVVESGPTADLMEQPAHPYTEALLSSVPDLRRPAQRLVQIEGQPPSIYDLPTGCPFAPRCRDVMPRCHQEYPELTEVGTSHTASCWKFA
jgi:oligopeptide/dipeptide ABC transporter ATP-binding protein